MLIYVIFCNFITDISGNKWKLKHLSRISRWHKPLTTPKLRYFYGFMTIYSGAVKNLAISSISSPKMRALIHAILGNCSDIGWRQNKKKNVEKTSFVCLSFRAAFETVTSQAEYTLYFLQYQVKYHQKKFIPIKKRIENKTKNSETFLSWL